MYLIWCVKLKSEMLNSHEKNERANANNHQHEKISFHHIICLLHIVIRSIDKINNKKIRFNLLTHVILRKMAKQNNIY